MNVVREPGRSAYEPPAPYRVARLGARTVASPLALASSFPSSDGRVSRYVPEGTRILEAIELAPDAATDERRSFEKAGPRERIYFDPKRTTAAILTSGGLCPGVNNVIRAIVLELVHRYGVASISGLRFGFDALDPAAGGTEPMPLGPEQVRHIHSLGGSILGTSRGRHEPSVMVDTLVARGISMLFAVGGDGTMRGAHAIAEEIGRRGAEISVVGVPKTIDNDIPFVDKSFGFETAVAMARTAIDAAHTEALSVQNGIGLVKLMGREAGFIAAHAAMASHEVNVCLVPEVPFRLDGPGGLFHHLERRLAERGHAVVVVAEGCGARLVDSLGARDGVPRDASGNLRFEAAELDIGVHLKDAIVRHFAERATPVVLKYVDPSYMLRGVPAGAMDAQFCMDLGRHAVHAAMAGDTDVMIGRLHRAFTLVPLPLVLSEKKRLDPHGDLWFAVVESTGQPRFV